MNDSKTESVDPHNPDAPADPSESRRDFLSPRATAPPLPTTRRAEGATVGAAAFATDTRQPTPQVLIYDVHKLDGLFNADGEQAYHMLVTDHFTRYMYAHILYGNDAPHLPPTEDDLPDLVTPPSSDDELPDLISDSEQKDVAGDA